MAMDILDEFSPVPLYALVAVLFTLIPILIAYVLAPRTQGGKTLATYECGIEPFGSAWIRYSITYYVYALIFIAFDVDILYLFPLAVSYTRGGAMYEFYTLVVFVLILTLAVIYAWGKGVFNWKRKLFR
jgi:NADH:ubiquinone oxidoreductase subunit 3 (subunit A)